MQDSVAAGERAGPQSAGGESLSGRPQFVRHPCCILETGVLAGGWDEVSSVSADRTKAYEHEARGGWEAPVRPCQGSECGGGPRRLSAARSIASDSDQRECVVCVGAVFRNRAAGVAGFEDGGD